MGESSRAYDALMYLSYEHWSPRYETCFYTFKMETFVLQTSPLSSSGGSDSQGRMVVGGKGNLPAYYYKIEVYSGHSTRCIYRRYSEFYWLYKLILKMLLGSHSQSKNVDKPALPIILPKHHRIIYVLCIRSQKPLFLEMGRKTILQIKIEMLCSEVF